MAQHALSVAIALGKIDKGQAHLWFYHGQSAGKYVMVNARTGKRVLV